MNLCVWTGTTAQALSVSRCNVTPSGCWAERFLIQVSVQIGKLASVLSRPTQNVKNLPVLTSD